MSRQGAVVWPVLFALFLPFMAVAALPERSLRGRAWLDLAEDGIYLRIDRQESAGPDGRVDDEFFLMMNEGLVSGLETVDLEETWVTSTSDRVTIFSPHTGTRYVWVLEDAGEREDDFVEARGPFAIDDGVSDTFSLQPARPDLRVVSLAGYGIRYSAINASRDEILADRSWQRRTIVAEAACDAGGECAAKQCSVTCAGGASCSVTCTGNTSSCCICTGPVQKHPSCHCVPC